MSTVEQVAVPSLEELFQVRQAVADGVDAAERLTITLRSVQDAHNAGTLERPVSWADVGVVFATFDAVETDAEQLAIHAQRLRSQLMSLWLAADNEDGEMKIDVI